MPVLTFLLRRTGAAVLLLGVLSVLTYGLLVASPGGPERALLGSRPSTAQTRAEVRAEFLLDKPFPERYAHWLTEALHGDFGQSVYSREPVLDVISERVPTTASLAGYAIALTLLVAVPSGLAAGMRRGTTFDHGVTLASLIAVSMPSFALGLLLLYGFAVSLRWFPMFGGGDLAHLTLPAIALAAGQAAYVVRQTRAAALDVGGQDYLTFAHSRGLGLGRIWTAYALRNAALPVLTIAGLLLAFNLTGAVFVEQVFSLPGLGSLLVQAVGQKDIPLVQALVLLGGAVVVAVNLLVDLAYLAIDPRIRHGAVAV